MSTAIFTVGQTMLTIETSELLNLEQMGHEDDPIALNPGVNKLVVGAGVFRLLSTYPVNVTADAAGAVIQPFTKDDGSPDPPKSQITFDPAAVREFFAPPRGEPAPE